MTKVRDMFRKTFEIFEIFEIFSKIFIEICMKMKKNEIKKIKNFRSKKFQKISLEIE